MKKDKSSDIESDEEYRLQSLELTAKVVFMTLQPTRFTDKDANTSSQIKMRTHSKFLRTCRLPGSWRRSNA